MNFFRFQFARSAAAVVALLILLGQAALPLRAQEPSARQAAFALEQLLTDSIARSEKSVVAIARVKRPTRANTELLGSLVQPFPAQDPTNPDFIPNEFGAGVVISSDGLILTSHHVIGDPNSADRSEYYVWTQRKPFRAQVLAADPWFDLAVLKIDAKGLAPIPYGDGKSVRKGQIVIALGNPHAIARDGQASASWGIISNLLRRPPRAPPDETTASPSTVHQHGTLIQTDAKLNVGFSGGALVNLRGEMIGLSIAYAAAPGFEKAAGFAIPVDDDFRRTVDRLQQGHKPEYGFMGIKLEPIASELRQTGVHGARVNKVLRATPAALANLRIGDVISHIDDSPVHDDDDVIRLVSSLPPGTSAILTVLRGDLDSGAARVLKREVLLAKKFVSSQRPQYGSVPDQNWRGLQADYSTAVPDFEQLAVRLDPAGCIHVQGVEPESAAWRAGLRAGMLISHVQRQRVATPADFYAAVRSKTGDVRLRVITAAGTTDVRTVSP